MSSTPANGTPRRNQRSSLLHGGGECGLRCVVCDCNSAASPADDVARALQGGGSRLVVRGPTESSPGIATMIGRAREEGYAEIVLRTNAIDFADGEAASKFAHNGADAVLVPLFSQMQGVHDRITGRTGALVDALTGIKNLARNGMGIEIEIPILPPRLQKLEQVVRLARGFAPALRAVRFFVPSTMVPDVVAPPPWKTASPGLAEALLACRELEIKARLTADTGIPLCALREYPDLYDSYILNPRSRSATRGGAILGTACNGCAVRAQCPGMMPSYRRANGEADIVPYDRKPKLMYEQRTTRRRVWTDDQRSAASKAEILVLRPTVNCNQDCTFCSANETSANVWSDHDEMLRAIARGARRKIIRLSFSGGEPTLSKHLVEYVHCASRLGVPEVEIVSNAVLLAKRERTDALVKAGLTHAFVSLHAHDESLSLQSTQKVGDFGRTVQGVKNLLDNGIKTALNHVITARNYPYLREYVEFVRREFGGRLKISFAFVTPQFMALDNIEVMPRLSHVMPYLKRAMYRAVEIGQPFSIGSRQGIPFCFLDEFRAWSDGFALSNSALSEDAPQKQKADGCDDCRFSNYCTGLWRPYVAKYGLDEIQPVLGAKLSDQEVRTLRGEALPEPWGVPRSFDEIPAAVREPDLETGPPKIQTVAEAERLPEFVPHRTRPLRMALFGSGRQARRLARGALSTDGISIDAVASPHAPQADLTDFGGCPAYADAALAIEDMDAEAVIVAAATTAHNELTRLAIERGVPVLVEKPLTPTIAEAEELREFATTKGARVVMAHNSLHAPGLGEMLADRIDDAAATYLLRRTPSSSDGMRTWSRSFLYETIYHVLAITGRACGGGIGEVTHASYRGEGRPEQLRMTVRYDKGTADVTLDYSAAVEEDLLTLRQKAQASDESRERTWRRQGPTITIADQTGVREVERRGNDVQRMLANFRDFVLGDAEPAATIDESIEIMRTAQNVVEAFAAAGAPFKRATAPKHVATRPAQQPFQ